MKDGRYNARAIDFGLSFNDNSQNVAVAVLFRVSEEQEEAGRIITWYGYFTENTTQRTVESLRHMGWTGNDASVFEQCDGDACERLLPSEVSIVVASKEYEGKVQQKVKWVNKVASGKVTIKNRLEGSAAKNFGARLKAACAAVPVETQRTQAPAKPKPASAQQRRESEPGQQLDNDGFPF